MIVGPAPCVASRLPATDVAMLHLFRVRTVRSLRVDKTLERPAHMPIKGAVIVHTEALRHIVRPGSHDVAEFRPLPLCRLDQIGVEAKLENGAAFGFASELRVDDLIGPVPETTWRIDTAQHIRPADPAVRLKCALDNDLRAVRHGGTGSRHSISVDTNTLDHGDCKAVR